MPYWGRSRRKLGCASPVDSGLRARSVNRRGRQAETEGACSPVAQEVDVNEQSADQQPRCEIDKIRKAEGECLRPGKVQLDGSMLCARHAELLRLEDHSENMLGEVFKMDQWLESVDGQADELGV